ncbi:MAG: glycosyltransferase family 4 protein [Patescibacteria group bacterium]
MSETNNILIATGIFSPDIGGPASYAQTLAGWLAGKEKVTVVTYSSVWNLPADGALPFRVVRIWAKWPKGVKHLIYAIRMLLEARNSRVIFALNAVSAGIPARFAARVFKRKFIVKIVGDSAWEWAIGQSRTSLLLNDFQKVKRSGRARILHGLQLKVCKSAHTIIVPSEYLGGIVHGWSIPREKIKIVYNGSDFKASPLSKDEAKKRLGIAGNVLFTWGRLVPWKGFRMLVKIMPKLTEINQFFKLVIVGSGPDRPILEAMIKNMKLERKVILAGRKNLKEVAEYLVAADMAILNSGYEGFSHQILEAMLTGVPLITTNAGGNKEIIHQGENGIMVKYNDEFNLIEVIRAVWNNPELQEHFIAEGKKTASHFSVEKMLNETVALLD